ncbi:molybdate ABC transporter substrate-binding protein [Pseudorhodobacter turbinis]|uniref:Molybdate ABC transporter substrate-binding protein n=1 Tax=Pseudorhodobacter turbinis TaxID=2500533 RepID=A0A4P8EE98_9RHOB|nr:molybdate ABC transporter substrate-binding protein [Pseudorhodobacter turbinis]QCO55057.1 molybdate ABC transporter substrate-binding protein [Pseudorhodobacter turbinis]
MYRPTLALLLLAAPANADTALAAVAANFASAATELATGFTAQTGHEVQITTGSTGKLYAQITAGAPFDLMLSADAATPARLQAEGHGTAAPYAIGVLTLWAPDMPKDSTPRALLDASIRHIAIANPDLAPYGAAAKSALTKMRLFDAITDKIVMGQNIGQTFALVQSGAAEAGFIARSALAGNVTGYAWDVSPDLYPTIRQDAILLAHGKDNAAAQGFLEYLASDAARDVIARYGYDLP